MKIAIRGESIYPRAAKQQRFRFNINARKFMSSQQKQPLIVMNGRKLQFKLKVRLPVAAKFMEEEFAFPCT